ncbi:uncharacterized protein LOC128890360 isoform X1 [Hylaeus anthracinus]|uniref:uncharacterized protein LOC128890360 isoform X1 n=1 Tax=Hylaeus anthracinus TaxID=313031 RepID=UPI0023B97E3A|nr:uncharacterized protein LOC128890360 isoform X1 [Hylaeus anthracinus]
MSVKICHNTDTIKQSHTLKDWCRHKKKRLREDCNQNHTSTYITDTSIHKLNNDCLILIFLYLPIIDRIRIESVCKQWKEVSQKSWYNIKKLDLQNFTWGFSTDVRLKQIDSVILHKVLSRCGTFLREIYLSKTFCEGRENALSIIGNLCPNLEIIDVSCLQVSSAGITSLITNCHNIKKLSLDCICLFDTDLEKLFKANQKLQCLKLVDNKISGKCLLGLPSETIEEIIIERCDYLRDNDIVEAIARLKNLKSLIIKECFDIWRKTTEAVGKYCINLTTLEITGKSSIFQFNGISHITPLINLKNLKASANWFICNSTLHKLSLHCQHLTCLDLSDIPGHFIRDYTLAAIDKFTKLEILITRDLYQVTSKGLLYLCNLKQLVCQECNFFDITISKFLQCSYQMEILDLSGCHNITNATLARAVAATSCRTNNITLNLFIGGTAVDLETFTDVSPFLRIIDRDLRYKRIFNFRPSSFLN